jgi:hypothetical protein
MQKHCQIYEGILAQLYGFPLLVGYVALLQHLEFTKLHQDSLGQVLGYTQVDQACEEHLDTIRTLLFFLDLVLTLFLGPV